MSSEKPTSHVLVIGGGVAGKTLSLFLHKASNDPRSVRYFTSTVYEAYPRTEKIYIGGGLGLAPNGVAILDMLGIGEEIKKRAGVARSSRFYSETGTELAKWEHD